MEIAKSRKPAIAGMGKIVWAGIGCATLFWILESAVHTFVFHKGQFITQILHTNPHEIWMRLLVSCMFITFGIYAHVIIIKRKRMEEASKIAYTELDHIFQIAGDGMCVVDKEFNVLRVNNSFERIFNTSASDSKIVGKKCYEIWEDTRCHTPECTLTRLLAGEDRMECEMVKKHTDGKSVPCICVATPLKGADGKINAIVSTYKDLTKLKMVQDQLLQSEKMAAIGQLAAGVAHEINNPVGFISSNLGTLNEYREDLTALIQKYMEMEQLVPTLCPVEENKELNETLNAARDLKEKMDIEFVLDDFGKIISESKEGTDRVKKIVADLKDFSHVDEHELTHADINKGLESTLNIVWNELKYKTKVNKDLGELPQVACYPQQLNQVFMNILVNAAQAIEKAGEIGISTSAFNGNVEVRISDTGKGIPEDVVSRIFEPFFTTKPVGKGTGLGLHMAYNIVKKHKGDIRVESTVGEGTMFIIDIPIEQ
jgi:PAS domain S-box-containing protein